MGRCILMNKENQYYKQSRKIVCRGAHTIKKYYYEWNGDDFNRWKQELASGMKNGGVMYSFYTAIYNTIKNLTWNEVLDDYLGKQQIIIHFYDGSSAKLADYVGKQVESDTIKRGWITPKRSFVLKLHVEDKYGKHLD